MSEAPRERVPEPLPDQAQPPANAESLEAPMEGVEKAETSVEEATLSKEPRDRSKFTFT